MNKITSRLTPYDDSYSTCERADVTLRIYAPDLDPEDVSTRLKLAPSSRQKRGEVIGPNSLGLSRVARIGGWFLSSEPHVQSRDLRRHLDWLLAHLTPSSAELLALQSVPGVQMSVNCIWWSASGGGGPTLWPEQMAGMAALNLECSFDISFYGSDEATSEEHAEA